MLEIVRGESVGKRLWWAVFCLVVLGIISTCLQMRDLHGGQRDIVLRFSLDGEGNVGAWFSSLFLAFNGYMLCQIGKIKRTAQDKVAGRWIGLGVIFFLLSLDEECAFHEITIIPLRKALHVDGFLHYAWVIPALTFVGIVLLPMLRLLRSLPAAYRWAFVLSGVIYVGGAAGMEMLGARAEAACLYGTWSYWIPTLIEETMELCGIVLFFNSVSAYFRSLQPDIVWQTGEASLAA